MGSLIGQRIDYTGVGVLRGQWDIPSKKMTKANLPFPPPSQEHINKRGQFILCKYLKNLPWSWETTRKPCLAKTLPNSSYLEQCSPTPWLTNINALTKAKKNHHYNQFCGWFRYFLEVCWRIAKCNTIQLILTQTFQRFSYQRHPDAKKKISVVGLVHGCIDSLYYPIPLQWVYLHWPLKTRPFFLFLGLSKGNLSCKSQSSS